MNGIRQMNYESGLKQAIEKVTSTMSKFEIERKLRDARLACGAVCTVTEAMESDQVKERDMLVEVDDKALGKIRIPGTVIKMNETPGGFTEGAPLMGEHTKLYLRQLGYSDKQIDDLIDQKIVEAV
jgi:CoA:oxalate CoA-transferase